MTRSPMALLCLVGFLAGCLSPSGVGPGARAIKASGTFVHEPSRFEFPENFGKFHRVVINQYDAQGHDIGVGYNLDEDLKIALTLYVYPPGRDASGRPIPLERQFELERANVLRHHPGGRSSSPSTPPRTQNNEPMPGHAVAFRYQGAFDGATRSVTSLLYLFEYDGWFVKYRITFAAAQEKKANLISQVFVSGFLWRGAA